jgi:hypothetical protein
MEIQRTKATEDPTKGMTPEQFGKMMKARIEASKGRVLPPAFRHITEVDWNRRFSWKERLQILFGYTLNVMVRIPSLHKPGVIASIVMAETSQYQNASEMLKANMQACLREQSGDALLQAMEKEGSK